MESQFRSAAIYGTSFSIPREVCARRARKLKRRGEYVHFKKSTVNGKSRSVWMYDVTHKIYKGATK